METCAHKDTSRAFALCDTMNNIVNFLPLHTGHILHVRNDHQIYEKKNTYYHRHCRHSGNYHIYAFHE